MPDIVARLRGWRIDDPKLAEDVGKAADEIMRLRAYAQQISGAEFWPLDAQKPWKRHHSISMFCAI